MCYVYKHIRLDKNEPFYIGIGSDKCYFRAFDINNRNMHWNHIVNKTQYSIEIIFDNLSWNDACQLEKEFITLYGRRDLKKGTLVNMTDGGEGRIGSIMNDITKKKISKSNTGKKHSEESKQKMIKSRTGRKVSEETKRKISLKNSGKKRTKEQITNIKNGLKNSIKFKNKKNTHRTGQSHSNETKLKIAEANRNRSIETRKKISESNTGKKRTIETKTKISNALKNRKNKQNGQF